MKKTKKSEFMLAIAVLSVVSLWACESAFAGRLVFTSDRDGNEEIYLMNMDGSNQTRLTNHSGADVCPVFSPDGQTIAFFSNRSGSYRIYTMQWNGSELQEVPNSQCNPVNTLGAGRGLAWSPEGYKLLFKPTHDALATMDLDGSNKTVLFTGGVGGHDCIEGVEWGPTTDDIYFNAHVYSWGYDQHIFHYSISGGMWTQITDDVQPNHSHAPKVSPDGSRIVFDQQQGWQGPMNIFTMDLDGSNESQLTFDEGYNFNNMPDWIGGGNEIVFSSTKSGSFGQIWLMDSTGGNLRMLEGEGNNYAPSWTPLPLEPTDPPIADAGPDLVADANELVTLDGSASYDPDGEIIRYTWKRLPDEVVIYSGEEPNCQTRALGRAEEVIELTVTDNYLATATDTVRIISRSTQDLQDQVAAMQSQIEELQRQIQELQALVDKIASWPPVRQWLSRPTDGKD